MNQTARIISIYAADTSGVCSALYEYGGMTVIHDASGCNSTYTTHDEPRWYDKKSMMFISGLTEKDAVMGNDDRFINDLIISANELKPAFIALCASPLPAMIGTDLEAIAYAVESETGIPSFAVKTNGMNSYIYGVANAFLDIAKRFIKDDMTDKSDSLRVNLLGMTPLDFPKKESYLSLVKFIKDAGFTLNACVGMETSLSEIEGLANADVNLIVSSSGKLLADYLYDEYNIPYVKGVPYGIGFAEKIKEALIKASETKENIDATSDYREAGNVAILGESVMSASLASALLLDKGIKANVLETVGDGDFDILKSFDMSCDDEKILENELKKYDVIIGDPLFKPICADKKFIELPHEAFSGRCFTKNAPNLIYTSLEDF
ncbi:MAG: oxidoreductase [Lachnospiraceae bacterium]|nr:oxidoreductase [Lachnospiraceae bacterium]